MFCDQSTEGGGWLDLVRSFHLEGVDRSDLLAHFFLTNNGAALAVAVDSTNSGPGLGIRNMVNGYNHTEGFHLRSMVPFTRVRTSYRMQGADEGYRCRSSNWIP